MYVANIYRCDVCEGKEFPCILLIKQKSGKAIPESCPLGYESEWKSTSETDAGIEVHE